MDALIITEETPRETRRRLNQMDRWAERNANGWTDAVHGPKVLYLRSLFELAYTAEHADYIAEELRALPDPRSKDGAGVPPPDYASFS